MGIITISRGCYSRGKEIAERVASQLGYECVARDVLLDASEQFSIPELKLTRAIHDAPSILERLGYRKERYLAYIQAAIVKRLSKDNVVYHGLAGHFFLGGISHLLKVRIVSDMEDRIQLEMEREHLSRKEALTILKKDDEERRKWSVFLYGIDTRDPILYDLTIRLRVGKVTPETATQIICNTIALDQFRPTNESLRAVNNLLVSTQVRAALVGRMPDAHVSSDDGKVYVKIRGEESQRKRISDEVEEIAKGISGVREVRVGISDQVLYTI